MDEIGIRADPLETILNILSASNICERGGDVCGASSIECVSSSCVMEEATAAMPPTSAYRFLEHSASLRSIGECVSYGKVTDMHA